MKIIGRVLSTRYFSTSFYGNPKYVVSFLDFATGNVIWGKTATDAACAYGITNSDVKVKAEISYHNTRSGNVVIDYCRPLQTERVILRVYVHRDTKQKDYLLVDPDARFNDGKIDVYSSIDGGTTCDLGWYRKTRRPTPEEVATMKRIFNLGPDTVYLTRLPYNRK